MAHYAREEIMSSSEVVRNFGAVLSSVVQHRYRKGCHYEKQPVGSGACCR